MTISKATITAMNNNNRKASASGSRIQDWAKVQGSATAQVRAIQTDLITAGIEVTSVQKSLKAGISAGLPGFESEMQAHSVLSESRTASFMTLWNRERDAKKDSRKRAKQTWIDLIISGAKKAKKSDNPPTEAEFLLASTEAFRSTEVVED